MIKHIVKIVWNKKRKYLGIFIEQMLVAFVLMFFLVKLFELMGKYNEPGRLDTKNVLIYGFTLKNQEAQFNVMQNMRAVNDNLKKLSIVKHITYSMNLVPFIGNDHRQDSVFIDDIQMNVFLKGSDEYGASVFYPEIEDGTWLINHPLDDGTDPVVVTRQFADKVGWDHAAGKKFQYNSRICTVVGVVAGLKEGLFDVSPAAMIVPMYIAELWQSSGIYAVKIKDNEDKNFHNTFYREFKKNIPSELAEPLLIDLKSIEQGNMFGQIILIVLLGLIVIFLTVFAFIGTMSLLWLHAQKSFSEFALRIASVLPKSS